MCSDHKNLHAPPKPTPVLNCYYLLLKYFKKKKKKKDFPKDEVLVSLEKVLGKEAPWCSTLAFPGNRTQQSPALWWAPPCNPVSLLLPEPSTQKNTFQRCIPCIGHVSHKVLWAEIKHQTNINTEHARIGAVGKTIQSHAS